MGIFHKMLIQTDLSFITFTSLNLYIAFAFPQRNAQEKFITFLKCNSYYCTFRTMVKLFQLNFQIPDVHFLFKFWKPGAYLVISALSVFGFMPCKPWAQTNVPQPASPSTPKWNHSASSKPDEYQSIAGSYWQMTFNRQTRSGKVEGQPLWEVAENERYVREFFLHRIPMSSYNPDSRGDILGRI